MDVPLTFDNLDRIDQEGCSVSRFGDLVKRLRQEKGLTQEEVAKKIGS